jgi:hypothetical protein
LLFIFSGQALALRCGSRLVDVGDRKAKILTRCGEPDFSETRERQIPANCADSGYYQDEYGYINDRYNSYQSCRIEIVDVWTYNFGRRKFIKELIFVDGVLNKINNLEYGY